MNKDDFVHIKATKDSETDSLPFLSKREETYVRCINKPVARELRPAIEAIDFITKNMRQADDESTIQDEWRYIAIIIDQMLLYVYSFSGHGLRKRPETVRFQQTENSLKPCKAVVGTFYYFWSIDYIGIYTLQSCASNNDWQICNAKYGDYSTFGDGLFGVNKND